MHRLRLRWVIPFALAAIGMCVIAPSAANASVNQLTGCKASTTPGAEMGHYPAWPGSNSFLRVACIFQRASVGTGDASSPTYTIHDFSNVVYHNGYLPAVCTNGPSTTVQNYCNGMSWTSGISYNNITWADTYDGLHNVISNNIIAGEADQRNKWVPPQPPTDGGGIIFDIANNGANTPAGLIINNVVYSNGGYCIAVNAKITNFWIVNNTCKKNNLDLNEPSYGSFVANASSNGFYFNNISYVWESAAANAYPYAQENTNTNIGYFFNQYDGRSDGACCKTFSSQSYQNFFGEDPKFANHPYVDATAEGQYATARPPAQSPPDLGLTLSSNSPAYNQGVDPTTYCNSPYYCASTAMSADVRRDIRGYLYTDFRGNPRPSGGPFDLGAYQH
jgi:hypothetical protein